MDSSAKGRYVPAEETRVEMKVANSRFLVALAWTPSVDAAKTFIGRIRNEFADASHNVPAFLIGHPPSVVSHCNDDGEPQGTAGRPALAVLQGSGYGDVAVVVTRYFGGTKLGTGGLVRAYGDAVREVLVATRPAVKLMTRTVSITIPYHLHDIIRQQLPLHGVEILDEEFGAQVTAKGRLIEGQLEMVQAALRELSSGAIQAETITSETETIVPIDSPLLSFLRMT